MRETRYAGIDARLPRGDEGVHETLLEGDAKLEDAIVVHWMEHFLSLSLEELLDRMLPTQGDANGGLVSLRNLAQLAVSSFRPRVDTGSYTIVEQTETKSTPFLSASSMACRV